jgi:transcriptional regulator with XRE-family HTH domain
MASEVLSDFGRRLDAAMREKSLTDSQLAKKLKWAQPQVFQLKRTKKPRVSTLQKLSKVLGKSVDFWSGGKESAGILAAHSGSAAMFLIVEQDGKEIYRRLI